MPENNINHETVGVVRNGKHFIKQFTKEKRNAVLFDRNGAQKFRASKKSAQCRGYVCSGVAVKQEA